MPANPLLPIGDGGRRAWAPMLGDDVWDVGVCERRASIPTPVPESGEEGNRTGDPLVALRGGTCRMDSVGEAEALERVLDLNGCTGLILGLRIGIAMAAAAAAAPDTGEEEREVVPPCVVLMYGSLRPTEDEDEFRLSLRRRFRARPDAGIG